MPLRATNSLACACSARRARKAPPRACAGLRPGLSAASWICSDSAGVEHVRRTSTRGESSARVGRDVPRSTRVNEIMSWCVSRNNSAERSDCTDAPRMAAMSSSGMTPISAPLRTPPAQPGARAPCGARQTRRGPSPGAYSAGSSGCPNHAWHFDPDIGSELLAGEGDRLGRRVDVAAIEAEPRSGRGRRRSRRCRPLRVGCPRGTRGPCHQSHPAHRSARRLVAARDSQAPPALKPEGLPVRPPKYPLAAGRRRGPS